jgi:hypothetical protein
MRIAAQLRKAVNLWEGRTEIGEEAAKVTHVLDPSTQCNGRPAVPFAAGSTPQPALRRSYS